MRFSKIVSVDNTGLVEPVREKLRQLAGEVELYDDFPKDHIQIITRINDADCLLVSWNTPIDREVIDSCPNLKYIGMCCSLIDEGSANVDIAAARERGIEVCGVRDYGDEGVVEFILGELIRLLHGYGIHQWKEEVQELTGQKLGIIGLGAVGSMLAERAMAFGMEVFYYNRSRKTALEEKGVKYLPLEQLLKEVDILSTHLPRNTKVLFKEHFELLGNHKIFINTALGPTFDLPAFLEWIEGRGNYAIFDRVAMGDYFEEFATLGRLVYSNKTAGWTAQAKERLSYKVLENMDKYFEQIK
jgi:lactate dehydrogenase-like 2-hydroxyacid dehydrogenase